MYVYTNEFRTQHHNEVLMYGGRLASRRCCFQFQQGAAAWFNHTTATPPIEGLYNARDWFGLPESETSRLIIDKEALRLKSKFEKRSLSLAGLYFDINISSSGGSDLEHLLLQTRSRTVVTYMRLIPLHRRLVQTQPGISLDLLNIFRRDHQALQM